MCDGLMDSIFGGGAIQPLLTLGVSGSGGGWGTSLLWVQASEEGEQQVMSGQCKVLENLEF